MITWIRTSKTLPGKVGEGVFFAKEIAAIVERVIGKKLVVATSFGGGIGEIAWTGQYDNAGQAEELLAKLTADPEYMKALTKVQGIFIPGGGHDQIWRHV